jgi:hypothetical protein
MIVPSRSRRILVIIGAEGIGRNSRVSFASGKSDIFSYEAVLLSPSKRRPESKEGRGACCTLSGLLVC